MIYMGLPRPPLIVLLYPALMLTKVVQLRPSFNNVPCATFSMHLFSSVLWEVPVCKGIYLRGVFIT